MTRFRRIGANVSLLAISILVIALVVEGLLRAYTVRTRFLDSFTAVYWESALHERMSDESAQGTDPYLDIVHDPMLGWRMTPNYATQTANHDANGFRVTPPAGGEGRIVAIGDSFTYGVGVLDDETYPAVLSRLTGKQTINAGVNGFGVDQAFLLWEEEKTRLAADFVILGYYVDDFYRNTLAISSAPKPYFVREESSGSFVLGNIPVPDALTFHSDWLRTRKPHLRILDLASYAARQLGPRFRRQDRQEFEEAKNINAYILRRLDESVRDAGAKLLVVIIGSRLDGLPEYVRAESAIEEECESQELRCVNIAALMREQVYDSFYGNVHHHWSPSGHRLAAFYIDDALRLDGLR